MNDVEYMKIAMNLSSKARGQTSPNPMVAAVIVKDGQIIAQGFHRRAGTDHAEIVALKKAKALAGGSTLYVTLEPCCHFGRTPPCVDQIIAAGIRRVVIGMRDPNPLVNGRSIERLRKSGISVKIGLLQRELEELNEVFVKFIKQKMPFVVAKSAQTLDGKIALADGRSKWITSRIARDHAHRMRNEFDAIMVGINTVLKDNPFLNASRKDKQIKKVIVDSRLRLPLKARLFERTDPSHIIIATTAKSHRGRLNYFQKKKCQVIVCPDRLGRVDLKWFLRKLAEKEISSVLLEGGARLVGSALKYKLVDKMVIYIAPKVLGDARALNSVIGLSPRHLDHLPGLRNLREHIIGDDICVEGRVVYPSS